MKTQKRRKGFGNVLIGVVLGGITVIGGLMFAHQAGYLSQILANEAEYHREVVIEEVPVSEVELLIQEAKDAALPAIESEGEEVKQNYINDRLLEIEIEVRDQYIENQKSINLEKKEQTKDY